MTIVDPKIEHRVDLRHPRRRRRYPTVIPQGHCRACAETAPVESMVPVHGPADLDTLLTGKLLCRDEETCLARAGRRNGRVLYVVADVAENWATGGIVLVTDNPRTAEMHGARHRGAVLHWPIHTDYRKG